MRRFAELYAELDQTSRTTEKVAALEDYFRTAPPRDAAWALYFLTGRRLRCGIPGPRVRDWLSEETGLPLWLIEESYERVGDQSETFALLLSPPERPRDLPLHELVEERLAPLPRASASQQKALLVQTWRELPRAQTFLFHKLISGSFRVGVARGLVVRALAKVAEVDPAVMAHRLLRRWTPTAAEYLSLTAPLTPDRDPGQPYPFFLASPLTTDAAELGPCGAWQAEWKWDGIRAQLVRRGPHFLIWSRGEELLTEGFPELRRSAAALPDGIVLDGEILAWEDERPMPFARLQRRILRKSEPERFWPEVPVVFMAYDLLEAAGQDWRARPLSERRGRLEALLAEAPPDARLRLSPLLPAQTWDELAAWRGQARARGVEGLMLKRRASAYAVGRTRGDWWKWKLDPLHIDAVLTFVQHGSGQRAGLYTDYTFGVWSAGRLVTIAKAYSGLSQAEIRCVDQFVRQNTLSRRGPLRAVRPELVFELAFEQVQRSTRRQAGIALRFPRIARWRTDKRPEEADQLAMLLELLE